MGWAITPPHCFLVSEASIITTYTIRRHNQIIIGRAMPGSPARYGAPGDSREWSGFTLIELLIVIAIIGLFAQVSLSTYATFTARSAYTEVVLAAQGYKRAVDVCVLSSPIADCNSGGNGIPASSSTQAVASVVVSAGVITVTPKSYKGLDPADVYTLSPVGGGNGQNVSEWLDNCDVTEMC